MSQCHQTAGGDGKKVLFKKQLSACLQRKMQPARAETVWRVEAFTAYNKNC